MDSGKAGGGRKFFTGLFRVVMLLVLLALVGAVLWLVSERNARTYGLRLQGDQLVVVKGRMLPTGADPWTPGDPLLADAYAPIPLEGHRPTAAVLQARYTERDELDRALFRVLEALARPRVHGESGQVLERGLYYLRRMQQLSGVTQEQRLSLGQLQTEVAFYQAKLKLEQARRMVVDALGQLEVAAASDGANAQHASQILAQISGPARNLERALRSVILWGQPQPDEVPELTPLQPEAPTGAQEPEEEEPTAPQP
jgi:hypothetical protein